MPVLLNPKHERFAQELASGKSAEEAHGLAGYKASRSGASQLKQNINISNRIAEILVERESIHAQATADAVKSVGLTKQWVIETLMENVARSMQAKSVKTEEGQTIGEYQYQGSVANRALELLGKEVGMFIDRKEVRTGSLDELPPDTLTELREQLNAERVGRADSGDRPEAGSKPH
jgi:phage terminase small subunit